MKQFIKVMKALSDPSRVKILKMLQCKAMCVCEIQELLELAQSTISKHLKLLEDAGLVESTRDKLWVNYRLADNADSVYAATLLHNLHSWLDDDPAVSSLMQRAPEVDRITLCKN